MRNFLSMTYRMAHQVSQTRQPILAIVSHTLRRDLEEPLRYFKRLRIIHLYRDASYQDMTATDSRSHLIRYRDARHVAELLAEIRPDIIQGPEPYASRLALRNAWAVYRCARRTRTPYFFPVFENVPPRRKFGPILGVIMEQLLGWYGRAAAGVIALNAGAEHNLLAAGIDQRTITRLMWGTWGIDTQEFRPLRKHKADRPTVFFVGRISAKKGLDDLLTAWESILAAVPTARLMVGGPALDADSQALLECLTRTPASTYLGPIKNAELPRYFQQAWVTVAPSVTTNTWAEQVGMINLQSLACGTPVVTTRSGAISEYVGIGNGALLVPEHDVTGLSETVAQLLKDDAARERLGKQGRAYIQRQYEVSNNVRRCEAYVLGLLERHTQKKDKVTGKSDQ